MSFDCLDPNLNLDGTLFLEASAGTGKTFAIEHLALRLIVEKGIPLPELLIVTFTRAAARELKERLLSNLEEAKRQIGEGALLWPYLKKDHLSRIEEALGSIHRASILTIHGFCHRMLSEYAFETGAPFSLPDPDGASQKRPLIEEVHNFFRRSVSPEFMASAQLKILLKAHRGNMESLALHLIGLSGQELPKARSFSEIEAEFLERAPTCAELEDLEEVTTQFKGIRNRLGEIHERFQTQIQALRGKNFAHLLSEESLFSLLDDGNVKGKGAPLPDKYCKIKEALLPLIEEACDPALLTTLCAQTLKEPLARVKEACDLYTPDDLIEKMVEASESDHFAREVVKKYRGVIIDEFQDTDRRQWTIFKALFLPDKVVNATFVGDPKQSIYGFRGADLTVYFEAKASFERVETLGVNYRSSKEMIDDLNALFLLKPDWLVEDQYRPVTAGKGSQEGSGLTIWVGSEDMGRSRTIPTRHCEESLLFPAIAKEICEKKYPLDGVAVLVKDRFSASRLESYLRGVGIGAISKGITPLKATAAFAFLDFLFVAIDNLSVSSYVKRYLGHAFLGRPLEALTQDLSAFGAPLSHLHLLAKLKERGEWGPFFHELLSQPLVVSREDRLDLMQLAELVMEGYSFDEIGADTSDVNPKFIRQVVGSKASVTIMTLHMSKGLEFPVVFALGLAYRHFTLDAQKGEAETMRELYVALTRAKSHLYFPILFEEKGRGQTLSPSEVFFRNLLPNLSEKALRETLTQFTIETLERAPQFTVPDFGPSGQREPHLELPPSQPIEVASFTALAKEGDEDREGIVDDGLVSSAETGQRLHDLLETVIERHLWHSPHLFTLIESQFPKQALYVEQMVKGVYSAPLIDGWGLKDVNPSQIVTEVELLFAPEENLRIKGFADALFCHNGKYYLIDWKSNLLKNYDPQSLDLAMKAHDYPFQATLYSEALRLYLRHIDPRPFETLFGGVFYIFLRGLPRGQGIVHLTPDLTELNNDLAVRLL